MSRTLEYLFLKRVQHIILGGVLLFFILIALDVVYSGALTKFDMILNKWSVAWHGFAFDTLFLVITKLGNTSTIFVLSFVVTVLLLWQRELRDSLVYWGAMTTNMLLFSGLKILFERPRPSLEIGGYIQHGYSFPSGHATMSMTFALLLFYLFYHKVSGVYRVLLVIFALCFPLVISFSRIYLGVHYFSDVVAGLLLGFFGVTMMVLSFKKI